MLDLIVVRIGMPVEQLLDSLASFRMARQSSVRKADKLMQIKPARLAIIIIIREA